MTLKLTNAMIKQYCSPKIFERAQDYLDAISAMKMRGDEVSVKVYGNDIKPYRVTINLNQNDWKRGFCTCPSDYYPCKHIVAVLLKFVREGVSVKEPCFEDYLMTLDVSALRLMLLEFVERKPELLDDPEEDDEFEDSEF